MCSWEKGLTIRGDELQVPDLELVSSNYDRKSAILVRSQITYPIFRHS